MSIMIEGEELNLVNVWIQVDLKMKMLMKLKFLRKKEMFQRTKEASRAISS